MQSILRVLAVIVAAFASAAGAAPLVEQFHATLDTGSLQGTTFDGTFSYDPLAATGRGREFLPLLAIDFTLLGRTFSRNDIYQGGQAILDDGTFESFTAAFLVDDSTLPISTIAFGFGGPGVIGYAIGPGTSGGFGEGHWDLVAAPVPELPSWSLLALGLLPLAQGLRRRRPAQCASVGAGLVC